MKYTLQSAFENADIFTLDYPYNPYENKTHLDASGIYLNYLQMKEFSIVPLFGKSSDKYARDYFKQSLGVIGNLEFIDCSEIAKQGGALNCITWTIKK